MSDDIVQVASGLLPTSIAVTITFPSGDINTGNNTINEIAHGRWTGDSCTVTGGGLSTNTVYYIRRVNANTLKLHTTLAGAFSDTNIASLTATQLDIKTSRTFLRGPSNEDFVWSGGNLTTTLVMATVDDITSVNSGTGVITTVEPHGRWTGEGCFVTASAGAFTPNTVAYYVRWASANTLTLHATLADALDNANSLKPTSPSFDIKVLRDPQQGIYVINPGAALNGANGANVRQIAGWVSPRMFGASTAAADQSAPIMAALNFARYSYNASRGAYDLSCDFEGQIYSVTRSINLTGLTSPYFHLHHGGLSSTAAGKIALDMTRQNSAHLNDFTIIGQEATPGNEATAPAVGLLYGRDVDEDPAPNMRMEDVTITGKFSKACVINLASEVSSEISCIYNNEHRSLTAYAAAYVDNPDSIEDKMGGALTSEYADLPAPNLPTPWIASNLSHYVSQANFRRRADVTLKITGITKANPGVVTVEPGTLAPSGLQNNKPIYLQIATGMVQLDSRVCTVANISGDTFQLLATDTSSYTDFQAGANYVRNQTGPAVLVAGAHGLRSNGGYMLAYGSPCVVIDVKNTGGPRNFDMEFQQEPDVDTPIRFDGENDVGRTIANFRCTLHASSQKVPNYVIGQVGAYKLVFQGFYLNIPNLAAPPSGGLFQDPANIVIRHGEIAVFTAGVLTGSKPFDPAINEPTFSGTVTAYDRFPRTITYDNAVATGNFIDNGAFDIWQRGISFTAGGSTAIADRWRGQRFNSALGATFSQGEGFAGSHYSLRIQRNQFDSASNVIGWWQQIETARAIKLAGRTCMLAFDCKRGLNYTGATAVIVRFGTGTDEPRGFLSNFGAPATPAFDSQDLTITASATVSARVFATIKVPAATKEIAVEMRYIPATGSAGAAEYLEITNVTFEPVNSTGNGPPPFQRKTFQEELIECQRFLRKSFAHDTSPAQDRGVDTGEYCFAAPRPGTAAQRSPTVLFGAPMRVAPAITLYNPDDTNAEVRNETISQNCSSTASVAPKDTGFRVTCIGHADTLAGHVLGFHWLASCEF